jgi:hypothetical protein
MSLPERAVPAEPGPPAVAPRPAEVARERARREAEAAVLELMASEADKAERRADAERRRLGRRPAPLRAALLLALLAGNAYLWFGKPSWLTFKGPPAPPLEFYADSWRTAVYLQGQRIDEYRRAKGRAPERASEAGRPVRGVEYARLGDREYQLAAGRGEQRVVFHSASDTLAAMVGRSMMRLGLYTAGVRR